MQLVVWLVSVAAATTAVGVLWRGVKAFTRSAGAIDEMVRLLGEAKPTLEQMVELFGAHPQVLPTLAEIGRQFQIDGGVSLPDMLGRLDRAVSTLQTQAAEREATAAKVARRRRPEPRAPQRP